MRSETVQRILNETPQGVKDKVRRHADLLKLGFHLNEHQSCYMLYKYDSSWYVDLEQISDYDDQKWSILLEDIKYDLSEVKNRYYEDLRQSPSYDFAKKEFKKKLRDIYNGLNSKYKEGTKPKLARYKMTEECIRMEAQVEILKEILKEL